MIVDQALYAGGTRRPCGDLSDELAALRSSGAPGDFLWIGLKDPTLAEFDEVNDELGLHPLAVEDAIKGRQRAKVELYDTSVFVVLKPLRYVEESSDIETGELMCFVGDRFIVTVRRGEASPLTGLRHRLEADPEALRRGPMGVLHAIVDLVVDGYRVIDEEVGTDLEDIETRVFSDDGIDSSTIYRLKREVLEFRRAAAPLAAPLHALHATDHPHVTDHELRLLFRDVSDHLQSVIEHVESYDRLLTDVLGAHLAQVTVQQNSDMRRISAWVAIAAVPTMVAGIYGMNFEFMPELVASVDVGGREVHYGYFAVVTLMAVACLGLFRAFKRSGWL
ncbi:magnesium and cobalt transport protein CorA [Fodinibacter luteus]|uniref:magnesium and cobalt transport protein CorA n=1 Tax=Fodinibacter luteus TaxID=552064 RepID=UPI0031E9BF3A